MGGVFNDLESKAISQGAHLPQVARQACKVHWNDHMGQRALGCRHFQFSFKRRNRHVPRLRVDVDEINLGAAIERTVGRGKKAVWTSPDALAGPHVQRHAGDVQASRGI